MSAHNIRLEVMQLLEKKILESRAKKDQMIARARTAQSTQKVNDMISGITGKTSMDAFKRMEEKVEALEASAEVSKEMTKIEDEFTPKVESILTFNQRLALHNERKKPVKSSLE